MALTASMDAPSFSAPDQDGNIHTLADYEGKFLLLYFYPKDDTPGCTKEACAFRDQYENLKQHVEILGVSADSSTSHIKFREKYSLPFPLLSDSDKKIIQAYGADGVVFPKRVSFLIGPDSKIVKVYPKVNPDKHAAEILNDVTMQK